MMTEKVSMKQENTKSSLANDIYKELCTFNKTVHMCGRNLKSLTTNYLIKLARKRIPFSNLYLI